MTYLALGISGGGGPTYNVTPPGQIQYLMNFLLFQSKGNEIQTLLSFAITFLLTLSVLLTLIFLIIGGIRWIMSQGDKKQLETAQKTIQYAIIGLVVVLLSFFIINFIGFLFNINLLAH